MHILVTGGAGFIGSHISCYLSRKGYTITVLDNFSRSSNFGRRLLDEANVRIVEANILDKAKVRSLVGRFDIIVHCAAYIDAAESVTIPETYAEVNVVGTVAMLKLSVDVGACRFIYLSSAAVYGEPQIIPIPETHPTRPVNPYGASKLAGEIFVDTFYRTCRLPYVILRLFNVYGPGQSETYAGLIAKTISRALRDEPPIIYGSGEQTRDFVYIKDVVQAIEKAIVTENICEIYNIGTGREYKVKDVVNLILELLGKRELRPVYYPPRPGDIQRSCADITKARKLLSYEPQYDLRKGLEETLSIIRQLT